MGQAAAQIRSFRKLTGEGVTLVGSEMERILDEVLAMNQKSVDEFRAGKDKAFNALVGQVMKATQGKANPAQAGDILRRLLA